MKASCPLESGSEGCKNVEIFESGELVQQQAAHCKEGEETAAIEILMFSLVLFPFFSPSFFFFFPCSPLVLLFWGISAAAHCKEGGGSSSHWNIDGPEAEALPYLTVLPFLSISCQILMNKYWCKCKYKYKYNNQPITYPTVPTVPLVNIKLNCLPNIDRYNFLVQMFLDQLDRTEAWTK